MYNAGGDEVIIGGCSLFIVY